MNKNVYIVHRSAMVQKGLAEILCKNFKCHVNCYNDFISFSESEIRCDLGAVIFIEDEIADTEAYLRFSMEYPELRTLAIINSVVEKISVNILNSISLYDSDVEIYEQVKPLFKQQEKSKGESEELSNRELDVLKLVANGFSNKEIAEKLFISPQTVMSHRKNITEKLGIKSISGLTVYAIINNYIDTSNMEVKDLI